MRGTPVNYDEFTERLFHDIRGVRILPDAALTVYVSGRADWNEKSTNK